MTSKSTRSVPGWTPLAVAAVLFVVQAVCTAPGELVADSREQLRQAMIGQFSDWHPPIMALVWRWLLLLGATSGGLLVLHQFLHWLGVGLLAHGCRRSGRPRQAWFVLAAGAFPLFLFYDRVVVKDVGMASALIAASAILTWFVIQDRRVPIWAGLLAAVCLIYGTLIRANAVFAIGPLLLLYSPSLRRLGLPSMVACSMLVALVAVPASNWVNHQLIGASPQYPAQSLQLFDLMGIAVHSDDSRVLSDGTIELAEIRQCYTPYWWDPVSPWGSCPTLRRELGFTHELKSTDPAVVAEIGQRWRKAIVAHPLAYLTHRLEYFNSSVYFFVPAFHFRYSKEAQLQPYGTRQVTQGEIRIDYLKNNPFFWPVVWLYLGLCALALLRSLRSSLATVQVATLLSLSGVLFGGAYFLIGVATEYRYYYWSTMAILLALILAARELYGQLRARPRIAACMGAGLLLIEGVGLAARLADVPFL